MIIFLYQITHHWHHISLICIINYSVVATTTLNMSNLDAKHALATDALISFHTGLLITGTIYPDTYCQCRFNQLVYSSNSWLAI